MPPTCDDCLEQASATTDKCLGCEHFRDLLKTPNTRLRSEHVLTAHGTRFMRVISISIAVGGVIAALVDLPAVGLGMAMFAAGLWLADFLTHSA